MVVTAKAGVSVIGQAEGRHVLESGDALTVMAPGRISWMNEGPGPARALWIYTPYLGSSGSPFRGHASGR
ncbi:hypothetical protein [Arthrobacter sp. MYb51]|uniref:hypothetical protein n=1 Tax=Arthrobacter sp. MYb51 TaxID=1848604 RepID=UPI0021572D54|nr:hypothetical protein [Arthrobacter sp. MYb51]